VHETEALGGRTDLVDNAVTRVFLVVVEADRQTAVGAHSTTGKAPDRDVPHHQRASL